MIGCRGVGKARSREVMTSCSVSASRAALFLFPFPSCCGRRLERAPRRMPSTIRTPHMFFSLISAPHACKSPSKVLLSSDLWHWFFLVFLAEVFNVYTAGP